MEVVRAPARHVYVAKVAFVALVYVAAAKAGLALAYENSSVTAIWAPTGIALAALVLGGPRLWPGVALGALLANAWTGIPAITLLGITAGNTLEALAGVHLLRAARFRPSLGRVRDVIALVVLAAGLSTLVSATIGVVSLRLGGVLPADAAGLAWRTWWLGDMGGDLLVAPLLLLLLPLRHAPLRMPAPLRLLEAVVLGATTVAMALLVFTGTAPVAYLVLPFLIWAALRFRQAGAAVVSFAVAAIAVAGTASGVGPFADGSPDVDLLLSQTFIGVGASIGLVLAAVTAERRRAQAALVTAHAALEAKVGERTAALARTQARLVEAQELAQIGSWEWDVPTDAVSWSDELHRIYGVTPGEHEATFAGYLERVHADDRERVQTAIGTALADGEAFRFDERIVRPDGTVRTLASRGHVHRDPQGRPLRMVGICQDVTESRRAERALRDSEERFHRAFDDAGTGMALIGVRGEEEDRFLEVNEALCLLLRTSSDDLLGVRIGDMTHHDDIAELKERVRRLVAGEVDTVHCEGRLIDADGGVVWIAFSTSLIHDGEGQPLYAISQLQDMTERKRFEVQLQHLADHDPITGLFNRRRFDEELARELASAQRYHTGGAVLALDLDNFKYVNDTLGHSAGDELITSVSEILRGRLRTTDIVARLGGDEFAIILPHVDERQACRVASDLLDSIRSEAIVNTAKGSRRTTASIGIALFPESPGGLACEELLVEADIAMYDAKEGGRDQACVFDADSSRQLSLQARMTWSDEIRAALAEDRFTLHAQAIVPLQPGGSLRHELLVRMISRDGDLIPPGSFLPVAERFDLVQDIDRWVVARAIELLGECRSRGEDVRFEVNLSAKSLGQADLPAQIARQLAAAGVEPSRLIFEVTETAAIVNVDRARQFARRLGELGCGFALDDFGAGFASFYYLKHLPFDYLKIDGEFVESLTQSKTNQLVVQSLVTIARGLGKQTIAEYVGDEETFEMLRAYGVDYAQGFYVGHPAPLAEIELQPSAGGVGGG